MREWLVCLWSVIAEGLGDVDKDYKGVAGLSDVVSAMIATSLDGGASGPTTICGNSKRLQTSNYCWFRKRGHSISRIPSLETTVTIVSSHVMLCGAV